MDTTTPGPNISVDDLVRQLKMTLAEKGIADGANAVLAELKNRLPARGKKFDTLIILEGRYNELIQRKHRNVISADDLDLEMSKLSEGILDFINHLEDGDFQVPDEQKAEKADARLGKVLYAIPAKMQVEEEVECRVWIAFDLDALELEIRSVAEKELRDVRVSDVMGVELFDHGKNEAFEIVTYDEQVQKIEEGLSTQWTFFVTPRKEGKFPLILKISIVLVDENNEKIFKTVVLREIVQITTLTPDEEKVKVLAKEAQQFTFLLIPAAGAGGTAAGSETITPDGTEAGWWQKVPAVAKIAAGVIGGAALIFFLWRGLGGVSGSAPDRSAWDAARASGDTVEIKNFMADYPDSEHYPEAARLLDDLRSLPENFYIDLSADQEPQPETENDSPHPAPAGDSITAPVASPATEGGNTDGEPPSSTPVPAAVSSAETSPPERDTGLTPIAPIAATGTTLTSAQPREEPLVEKPVFYRYAATKPVHRDCEAMEGDAKNDCTESRILETVKNELTKRLLGLEGSCRMTFVISKTGAVTDIIAEESENEELSRRMKDILGELPDFIPGRNSSGEQIDVRYTLPVRVK